MMEPMTDPLPGAASDLPILAVSGELDLAVAPGLRDQFDGLFATGAASVVVDLSEATFLDSPPLGVLAGALNQCRDRGGELHRGVEEPQILRVLSITGLTDAFRVH